MALVTRYFSTAAAGTGDGTTWANRAQLVSGSTWSTVITGFNFASDSLLCLIGPGTHSPTAAFTSALYTSTAPSGANRCFFAGCDSSGNELTPPDPDWTSDQAPWDASGLPVLATTTNINTITSGVWGIRLLKFTATSRTSDSVVAGVQYAQWCVLDNSSNNSNARGFVVVQCYGCVLENSGAAYFTVLEGSNLRAVNCRVKGAVGSSGNRRVVSLASTSNNPIIVQRCTVIGGQVGIYGESSAAGNSASMMDVDNCVITGAGATGITCENATTIGGSRIQNTVIVNCTTNGVDANTGVAANITNCRFRDNGTNIANLGNGIDYYNYTTDAADSDDFVNAGSGDYRIKSTAAFASRGIGVSVQAASGGRVGCGSFG